MKSEASRSHQHKQISPSFPLWRGTRIFERLHSSFSVSSPSRPSSPSTAEVNHKHDLFQACRSRLLYTYVTSWTSSTRNSRLRAVLAFWFDVSAQSLEIDDPNWPLLCHGISQYPCLRHSITPSIYPLSRCLNFSGHELDR